MSHIALDFAIPLAALLLVLATLPGSVYLLALSLAGWRRQPPSAAGDAGTDHSRGVIAIIVPAHNEAGGIARTVGNLLEIARADGAATVVVIADNCSDATAQIARTCGARVLERFDEKRRGKGYALDFAFRSLAGEGFFAYVVIDADSLADARLLAAVRTRFERGAEAVQARYTVLNSDASARTELAELALCAFNCLRPRGRQALGLSAGLLGNGFALRSSVLARLPYRASSVVEDLEYHLELVASGVRVHFADETVVRGEMPTARSAQDTQRARWEGGRLRMLRSHGGRLLWRAVTGQPRLVEPLLELLLLPLAYHTMLLFCLLLIPLPWAKLAGIFGLAVVLAHVLIAARVGGISWARMAGIVLRVPDYLRWKLSVLPSIVRASSSATRWIRTGRGPIQ